MYISLKSYKWRLELIMDKLKRLYIEPTSKCNLKCEMCFRHTWFDETFCDLPLSTYKRVLETMPEEVETIFFGGMGEPLCHKDILEMISLGKSYNKQVAILTNGSLLKEDMCQNLIDKGIDELWVSVDSFDPTTKNEVGHNSSGYVLANIDMFNKYRRKLKAKIKLGVTFVVGSHNVRELKGIPYFLDRYEINEVNISNIYPSDKKGWDESLYTKTLSMSIGSDVYGSSRPKVKVPYMDFDRADVQEGLTGLMEKMNFNLYIGDMPAMRKSQYCRFVEEGMCFVRSDGHVSPCMALLHNGVTVLAETERKIHHHSFGDMTDGSLKEIWESEGYASFRDRVINFAFPPCTNCGHCEYPESNLEDCYGNQKPTCGACLWAEGIMSCP